MSESSEMSGNRKVTLVAAYQRNTRGLSTGFVATVMTAIRT